MLEAKELQNIAVQATQTAQAEQYAPPESVGREQIARAWERLADAADALHAILARQELYDDTPEPGLYVR